MLASSNIFPIFLLIASILGENSILKNPHLLSKPKSNIFIELHQSLDPIYSAVSTKTYPNRGASIQALYESLRKSTSEWHEPVLKELVGFTGVKVTSFWITNKIYVQNATPKMVSRFLRHPLVKSIYEEETFQNFGEQDSIINDDDAEYKNRRPHYEDPRPEWHLKKVGATEVWNLTQGEGIYIGFILTGVWEDHSTIENNWAGRHGRRAWFDAIEGREKPYQPRGVYEGVSTISIATSHYNYNWPEVMGMAPKARFQVCRGFIRGVISPSGLIKCGQWITCPTQPNGEGPRCGDAPHISVNGWGTPDNGTADWYDDVIRAWIYAKIIPVFAAGWARKSECSSAYYPATHKDVISVGSTDMNDKLSHFSAKGPKGNINKKLEFFECSREVVPLIVAPGQDVLTADGQNIRFKTHRNGTTYAAAAVAGGIALLLSENNLLTYGQIRELLFTTTVKDLPPSGGGMCGKMNETEFPNNVYGWGRLDIKAAIDKSISQYK